MSEPKLIVESSNMTINESLTTGDMQSVKDILKSEGMVLLPSDTCYSLAAIPFNEQMHLRLNKILNREDMPISLAFPNMNLVNAYVDLNGMTKILLETYTPGTITVICEAIDDPVVHKFAKAVIRSKDGTIGVRIPDSRIEREIASFVESPITTIAIRDKTGFFIQNFQQAVEIVTEGMKKVDNPNWIAIEGKKFSSQHSTVVRVNDLTKQVEVKRGGAISLEQIKSDLSKLSGWSYLNLEFK